MAKYDSYTLVVQAGDEKDFVNLSLSVLFEDGDDIVAVMNDVKDKVQEEVQEMKRTKFVQQVKQ